MRRVVVTGVGALTPLANEAHATWEALVRGQSGIGPITYFDPTAFDTKFAGQLRNFDPDPWVDKKELRRMDTFIVYAIAASEMAVKDAGLSLPGSEDPTRIGVVIGSGLGGLQSLEDSRDIMVNKGPGRISPFFVPRIIVNLAPGHVSIRIGAKGPNLSPVSACATGNHAIGESFRMISYGHADIVIAGGCEGTITPLGVAGFNSMKALSTRNDSPTTASRPFDKDRDGFVVGEGAGILVLEELERAKARGARIYAEIVGYGMNSDAYHITAPSPDGEGAARCMKLALDSAKLNPSQVGYINAHGTSTPHGDVAETMAIKRAFGDHARSLMVSSTKSMTGHLLGAAGGIEALFSVLAIHKGVLPPTINLTTPDPECDLDYIPNAAREVQVETALSNSFGFGGTNACLIFSRFRG